MKTPTPKKKRTRLPFLLPRNLIRALETMESSSADEATKRQMNAILNAAADPEAQKMVNVIKQLPPERQEIIEKTAQGIRSINRDALKRGKERLDSLSDSDWERLVNDETD
jgi:hypothetical protein